MEKRTVLLATYGKAREHLHGDCIDVVKHDLGILTLDVRASSQIDMARSLLACAALAHGADVMVFVDSDILFDPFDVELLADSARETRGVVGAPYSMRRMGSAIVGSLDAEEAVFFEGGGRCPARGVIGMGFTAIHRDVFDLLDALPEYAQVNSLEGIMRPYFKKLVVEGYWLHEDASFCHAARQAGSPTHIDTRFRVKHLGDYAFGIEDCRRIMRDEPTLSLRLKARA